MNPRELMLLGAASAAVGLLITSVFPQIFAGILIFGGGALFGKGYGIWEERSKSAETDNV